MYSVKPSKICYVMEIARILGPVVICRNPGMTNIPKGALTINRKKCNGQFPLNHLATEGCELFRLNMWLMRWGCKRHGDFKECDPVGLVTGPVESCDGSGPGIRIDDPTTDISY